MVKKDFLVIAITQPDFYQSEAERINQILANKEADFIHIRKPYKNAESIEKLINEINWEFHNKLKLHDHFELLDKYDLGGIHLNSRNSESHTKAKSVSISLHSLEEIDKADNYEYFFISPVFDSISKEGYKSGFILPELSLRIKGKKAIALGGVTPKKFAILQNMGFIGAALLGYFFPKTRCYYRNLP